MVFSKSATFGEDDLGRTAAAGRSSAEPVSEDAAFIEKLKSGDADAFGKLVDRYSGDIFALLYRLTANPEDAHDLTQDTFLSALRFIGKFRGDAELKTWLFRIA